MHIQAYNRWRGMPLADADLLPELLQIEGNEEEIKDRFGAQLQFGTAGLRGVIGAGSNRMNIYTVAKVTKGLANYVLEQGSIPHAVAIAFDSRNKSNLFAQVAAEVLAANGIKVYLYKTLMPTPVLSFAVRFLQCNAGIMVTASHNPAKYNGYKAYGPDGSQMTSTAANAVQAHSSAIDIFDDVVRLPLEEGVQQGIIEYMPDCVIEAYYEEVKAQSVFPDVYQKANLKLVYSPLNGTGNVPVRRVLRDMGVQDITIVKEQELPDGNFPTAPYPNPETAEAMALGISYCEKLNADLLLATDPDADRVGIAVKTKNGHERLTGNEVGILLVDYLAKGRIEKGVLPAKSVLVKSIVTTGLADVIAADYGIETINVLTGFKYIGEQILKLEQEKEESRFFFGFEESYGYLSGTYVRDKDAVVASMLICEMASYYKLKGVSLAEQLEKLYEKYGYYLHKVDSFAFEGLSGMQKMNDIMESLRHTTLAEIGNLKVNAVADYQNKIRTDYKTGKQELIHLPQADVLVYSLFGDAEVIVRPSGTEPKIKVYYTTRAKTKSEAEKQQEKLAVAVRALLKLS